MPKGKTNNPNGRPKGTPNRITQDVRAWLSAVIDGNRKQMERDLKTLEPKDRLQMLEKLMQYVIPKQQTVRADLEIDTPKLDQRTPEEVEAAIARYEEMRRLAFDDDDFGK